VVQPVADAPLNWPAMQLVHVEAMASLYLPAAHP
jgi:hypothetical protein